MKKKKIKLVGVIAAAVLILGLALGLYFMAAVQTVRFDEPGFYHVNGIKYSVSEGDKAVSEQDKENVTIERKNEYSVEAGSLPLYYEERDAICLMTTMAYYQPIQEYKFRINKLNLFTELESKGGTISIKSGSKSDFSDMGFLFDGKDTYIFLQETEITYGKKKVTLSPLSYAIVYYNSWVQLYDRESDNYIYEEIGSADVTAVCDDNERYEINLGRDVVSYGDKEYLLHSAVDMYQSYF